MLQHSFLTRKDGDLLTLSCPLCKSPHAKADLHPQFFWLEQSLLQSTYTSGSPYPRDDLAQGGAFLFQVG